jgi:hypothetical protein
VVKAELFEAYLKALQDRRDGARGEHVFREKCATGGFRSSM